MLVGTGGAAAAGSAALSALRPRQTGAEKLTGCEKARSSTGMPAGAGMNQPPGIGTDAMVTGVTGLQTDMSGLAETEVLNEGMAEIAGTGQDPGRGTIGEGLTATERM